MNRQEIMQDCPEEFEERLKYIVDYFEGTFLEVDSLLSIKNTSDLYQIDEARELAERICKDLYG